MPERDTGGSFVNGDGVSTGRGGLYLFSSLSRATIIIVGLSGVKRTEQYRNGSCQDDQGNDFINHLTHEFKTPIASIALASKVLQQSGARKLEVAEKNYLQLISKESKRLENQVDKALQIAMADAGNFTLDKKAANLHSIICKVADSCELLLQEKEGRLELRLKAAQPLIEGDPAHLFNLVYNLLDNAIKYSEPPVQVTIRTEQAEEGLLFSIRDNGMGMEEDIQLNIFEKFFRGRSEKTATTKGFGLGLSYVKAIVEAHRGKISFHSQVGRGTEFHILLPRA